MNQPISSSPQRHCAFGLSELANILGLFGISVSLLIAFYYQLALHDLPCPLCLLQRVGMIMIGFGFLLNVRFGIRSAHYGVTLIGGVLTGCIAMRQVFLHIAPGDAGYGSTLFGLHFYTLAALTALATIVGVALLLMLESRRKPSVDQAGVNLWGKLAMILFAVLIAANLASTVLECGGGQCDANPTFYQLLGARAGTGIRAS
jgi:disulfide bond formation protein DsbB